MPKKMQVNQSMHWRSNDIYSQLGETCFLQHLPSVAEDGRLRSAGEQIEDH